MEKKWAELISDKLDIETDKLHKRDKKYYQIDRFKRMATRIQDYEDSCKTCKELKKDFEDISINLSVYIDDIPAGRRRLEKIDENIKKHLKNTHNIHPVYYFVSLYSFFGMIPGVIIGVLVMFILPEIKPIFTIGVPWFIGIVIGYFIGNKKDWAIRRSHRLL